MCRRCGIIESEAKTILEAYMECDRRKNDVAYEKQCHEDCDNCKLCYTQGTVGEHREAMNMAIKALEKQIPKKPTQGEPYWWIDTVKVKGRNREVRKKSYSHECPCCGKGVAKLSNIFCNHCGQKLDWSDTD